MTDRAHVLQIVVGMIGMVACIMVTAPLSFTQTVTGSVVGTIRDQQGAVIPNTAVSAKNVETGAERTAVSDASGGFTVASVPAGTYEVTAATPGFQTGVRSGIGMTVGAVVRVDFTLTLGAVTEKVEVTGEAPQVDTTTSTMAGLVSDVAIRELPLNGRDWLQLAVLQPGVLTVVTGGSPFLRTGLGMKMSISGGRPSQNVYRMDGLVVNDTSNNSPGGALGVNLGVDGIREFSVLTNTYSAEYGRSAGGVINAITKSGTNTLHGTAFEFLRNSALDARNFFDTTLPPFRRNQFGGAAGGPIKKDKLFFFSNYEGLRQFLSLSFANNTLSPNARNGILCQDPPACTTTTQVTVDPRVRPYLPLYPVPNGPIVGDTGKFVIGAGQIGGEDYVTGRGDYQLKANTTLAGSYTFDNSNLTTPDAFAQKLIGTQVRNQRAMLSVQHVFSPTVLDTIRTGVSRTRGAESFDSDPQNPLLNDRSLAFVSGQYVGLFTVPGLDQFGGLGSSGANLYWYTAPQLNDDLVWVKGRNNIRIGFSVEAIRENLNGLSVPTGNWTFGSIQDLLTVTPQQFQSDLPGTDTYRGVRTKIFGFYFQDDIRLRPNLTVNLGVRYEPSTVISLVNGKAANMRNLTDAQPTIGNPIYDNPTLRNFAPRVGFAWDPFGTGKTAVRSGFGIFDIVPVPNLINQKIIRTAPFYQSAVLTNPPASSFPAGALNLAGPGTLQTIFIEPHLHPAYKLQWNLNIQRQITRGLSLMAGYVGARGVHLPLVVQDTDQVPLSLARVLPDGHLQFPTTGTIQKINPNFAGIRSEQWDGHSTYHSLQVNVIQELRRGFTFQGVYAWSKSIDNGTSEYSSGTVSNAMETPYAFNASLQRGVSEYDIPQHVSLNFRWEAPSPHTGMAVSRFVLSGWELSGIYTAQTGTPFSVRFTTDRARTGNSSVTSSGGGQRPDFNPGPGCTPNAINPGHPESYVRLECFSFPALGVLGNLGRNTLRSPLLENFDFSLFKNDNLTGEKLKVQLRAEFFNLFNRSNFASATVSGFNSQGQRVPANAQLRPPTATKSRQIQFGIKLVW